MAAYIHQAKEAIDPYYSQLKTYLHNQTNPDPFVKAVQYASTRSHLAPEHIVVGAIVFALFMLLVDSAFAILSLLLGFIYPAYKSFKAIESQEKSDDTQWLIYWTVFAFFCVLEIFTDFILFWFPFYYVFKLGFLAWCMYPDRRMNGSIIVYNSVIKKFLLQHESVIDNGLNQASAHAGRAAAYMQDELHKE